MSSLGFVIIGLTTHSSDPRSYPGLKFKNAKSTRWVPFQGQSRTGHIGELGIDCDLGAFNYDLTSVFSL